MPLDILVERGRLLLLNRLSLRNILNYDLRIISTEQWACRTTACETPPIRKRLRPVRPWDPRTIISACHSLAASMICDFGSPSTNSVETLKFAPRNRSAAFATSSFACPRRAFQTASNSGSGPAISRPISREGGSTTCKTFTSEFGGHGLASTLCSAALENSEPSIAIRIFMARYHSNSFVSHGMRGVCDLHHNPMRHDAHTVYSHKLNARFRDCQAA